MSTKNKINLVKICLIAILGTLCYYLVITVSGIFDGNLKEYERKIAESKVKIDSLYQSEKELLASIERIKEEKMKSESELNERLLYLINENKSLKSKVKSTDLVINYLEYLKNRKDVPDEYKKIILDSLKRISDETYIKTRTISPTK